MRTLFEEQCLREVADEFSRQVVNAIKTKKIRRRSRKPGRGIFEAEVNATGKLAESVHHEFTDEGIQVLCNSYIDKLIFGQPPGEPVNVSDLQKWIDAKGLDYDAQSLARQIYLYGSSIYAEHQGQDSGLLSDVDISNNISRLQEKLTSKYADEIALKLVNEFNIAA
jgi:hypothetical protein